MVFVFLSNFTTHILSDISHHHCEQDLCPVSTIHQSNGKDDISPNIEAVPTNCICVYRYNHVAEQRDRNLKGKTEQVFLVAFGHFSIMLGENVINCLLQFQSNQFYASVLKAVLLSFGIQHLITCMFIVCAAQWQQKECATCGDPRWTR